MIDEALPRFTIAQATSNIKHHSSIFLSRPHSDPEPAYTLQRADPAKPVSRNRYGAGLFDAYNPDVVFGEVLIQPKWRQPCLSPEDLRRHGGIPPPPEPVLPTEYTIQLYDPDQQIDFVQKSTGLLNTTHWEFSLPQDVFRMPSASDLDRSQNDPLADSTTPKINFAWRKESKFSKEMTLYMTGRSTDITLKKKKSKEPDIAIAHYKGLKDITLYEPNLYRMELEDQKGFEVVLLLTAAILRDVIFARDLYQVFNITIPSGLRRESGGVASHSPAAGMSPSTTPQLNGATSPSPLATTTSASGHPAIQADPLAQWQLDAETARLRLATEAEVRSTAKAEALARREREKVAEEESRRVKRMVEKEERERRRKKEEEEERVAKETERLRRKYGSNGAPARTTPSPRPPVQGFAPTMSGALPDQRPSAQPAHSYNYQNPPDQPYIPSAAYASHFGGPQRPASSNSTLRPHGYGSGSGSGSSSRPGKMTRRSFLDILEGNSGHGSGRKKSSVH